jgi:hypothetical protein
MLNFQTFDQYHIIFGFITVILFFIVYPITNGNSAKFRAAFFLGIFYVLVAPFIVDVTFNQQELLLTRSGKTLHTLTFILWFYCCINNSFFTNSILFFFWFCFALTLTSLLDIFLLDVIFVKKYGFLEITQPYLEREWGIKNMNFTAPLNYLIKFIFLGLFFRDSLQNHIWKKVFQYTVWALVGFELVQVFVLKSYQGYDSLSSTVKNIFILGGAGLLLYRVYASQNVSLSLQKNAYFWICLGLILPALAELFLEFIFNKLYETDQLSFYRLYLIRNASQMVGFTLLIVGVWQAKYLRFLPKEF